MALNEDDTLAFLLGREVGCDSSNVQVAQYHAEAEHFIVGFGKPGDDRLSYYRYLNVPESMACEFAAAPSHGKWVNARLVKTEWPFEKGIDGLLKLYRQDTQ